MAEQESEYEKRVKDHLVALLHLFDGKPYLLAHYLLHFETLKKDFKNKLADNTFLKATAEDLHDSQGIIKPYFVSITEMEKYYNDAFQHQKQKGNSPIFSSTDREALLSQLRNAVDSEDYVKASRIKQYMDELGYDSSIF